MLWAKPLKQPWFPSSHAPPAQLAEDEGRNGIEKVLVTDTIRLPGTKVPVTGAL